MKKLVAALVVLCSLLSMAWGQEKDDSTKTFTGHRSFVYSVALSPDGRMALSGSWDGTLKLWDLPKM